MRLQFLMSSQRKATPKEENHLCPENDPHRDQYEMIEILHISAALGQDLRIDGETTIETAGPETGLGQGLVIGIVTAHGIGTKRDGIAPTETVILNAMIAVIADKNKNKYFKFTLSYILERLGYAEKSPARSQTRVTLKNVFLRNVSFGYIKKQCPLCN